jgi:hypothetical protein
MSTQAAAAPGTGVQAPEGGLDAVSDRARRWRPVRWTAVAGWLLLLTVWIWTRGVPLDRQGLLCWIAGGLLAASIGRRHLATVVLDWLPLALALICYDFARGASERLGGATWWTPQIRIDRWLFGGTVPTVWLQAHLKDHTPRWWDTGVSLTYTSFFLVPYVLAAVLWLRSRADFRRWVMRYVTLCFLAVASFLLFPAAPPWAAARCTAEQVADHPSYPPCLFSTQGNAFSAFATPSGGLLGRFTPSHTGAAPYVERISGRGFGQLHLPVAKAMLDEGQSAVDLVAAVPSLHAGVSLLAVLFLWPRLAWYGRVIGVGYVLTCSTCWSAGRWRRG